LEGELKELLFCEMIFVSDFIRESQRRRGSEEKLKVGS
jgi:hypothetical protein